MTQEQERRLTIRVRAALRRLNLRQRSEALAGLDIAASVRLNAYPATLIETLRRGGLLEAGCDALESHVRGLGKARSARLPGSVAAAKLKTAREARGWTQRRMAAYLRVGPATIARLETGERLPRRTLANRMQVNLGIPAKAWDEVTDPLSPEAGTAEDGTLDPPSPVDAWYQREIERALNRDPMLAHTRRLLAEHGPLGRPPHPEHSQAESEVRARQRHEQRMLTDEAEVEAVDVEPTGAALLRQARERLGFENRQMSRSLRLGAAVLRRIELGRHAPTLHQACRIQAVLGIPTTIWDDPADLLAEAGSTKKAA